MKLLSQSLQSNTAAQSSTIGWKECVCSKSVGAYTTSGVLQISIAAGNPLFYFTVFQEEMVTAQNNDDIKWIGWTRGYRVQTSGAVDNPNGNGACNFIPSQHTSWDDLINWAYDSVTTRTITWNTSNSGTPTHTIHRVMVYSERIDLITLSCV